MAQTKKMTRNRKKKKGTPWLSIQHEELRRQDRPGGCFNKKDIDGLLGVQKRVVTGKRRSEPRPSRETKTGHRVSKSTTTVARAYSVLSSRSETGA